MVYEHQTCSAGVENATPPVSPSQTSDKSRQAEGHAEEDGDVPFMLPPDDAVFAEVGDVGHAWLAAGFDDHPADMGPEEAMVRAIRVKIRVSIAMVRAVATGPPLDGALDGAGAGHGQQVLERLGGVVRAVSPEAVIAGCNA